MTALLASIGQSKAAKRTVISHSIFNITGAIVFACLIRPFAAFITYISPSGNEVDVIARQIANAHNPLENLSMQQLTAMYDGQYKQWTDLSK